VKAGQDRCQFHVTQHARLWILGLFLVLVTLGAILNGAFQIELNALFHYASGYVNALDVFEENILFNIRLPRVILAIFAGAALGVSGAVVQAIFRNPLAEPGLVGLTAGASLGAIAAIVLSTGSFLVISVCAFLLVL